jgi:CRP-like cAMP-binding protein
MTVTCAKCGAGFSIRRRSSFGTLERPTPVRKAVRAKDRSLLSSRPQVSRRWLSRVAGRLVHAQRRILQLQDRGVREKVAVLLLDEERDGVVELPQESLASLLSVRRQTVNVTLRHFEQAGLVRTAYRLVAIEDRATLASIAGRQIAAADAA